MEMQKWHTYREINQQPAIWRRWASEFGPQVEDLKTWIAAQNADEIWLSGAGTSAYIGDLLAAHLGADPRRIRAVSSTDLVSTPQNFVSGVKPLVISFGRSGNSAETLGTLDILDQLLPDAPRINITCNADSALATRLSGAAQQAIILPEKCHDAGFAMTSSYTTMLLTALLLLDDQTGPQDVTLLAEAAENMLPGLFSNTPKAPQRAVFVGSGALAFAAREAALKVMELAAGDIPSIWDSCLGFRHGPKSFVNTETTVFVFKSGHSFTAQYDDDLITEIAAQFGDNTIVACDVPMQKHDALTAVLYVLQAQVLATVWSDKMGLNVDNPFEGRGTLTRVVSGIKLYSPKAAL